MQMLSALVLFVLVGFAYGGCSCADQGKPTHVADIIAAAENILLVEVQVTDPPPALRRGRSGPGLRMEYKANVVRVVKGCINPRVVDIKQLVFEECPPPTLQGKFYISGAMGTPEGKTKRENIFYLDPCGLALAGDTPLKEALDTLGNECTGACSDGSPLKSCDDVCTNSQCGEDGAKCVASKCGTNCQATWVSDDAIPQIMCPSGLPSGAIKDGMANLMERMRLLAQAQEAFRLGARGEGFNKLAEVAKLSAGGSDYRNPPPETTTVETTSPAPRVDPQLRLAQGLTSLLRFAKRNPNVKSVLNKAKKRLQNHLRKLRGGLSKLNRAAKRLKGAAKRFGKSLRNLRGRGRKGRKGGKGGRGGRNGKGGRGAKRGGRGGRGGKGGRGGRGGGGGRGRGGRGGRGGKGGAARGGKGGRGARGGAKKGAKAGAKAGAKKGAKAGAKAGKSKAQKTPAPSSDSQSNSGDSQSTDSKPADSQSSNTDDVPVPT